LLDLAEQGIRDLMRFQLQALEEKI
jgi:hypothetical protein